MRLAVVCCCLILLACGSSGLAATDRLRLLIETDAGGDPDDEQSLVRFLLYANEWDVEGIIANRPKARDGENRNRERTGLAIVRRQLDAYGACLPQLLLHDARYPAREHLWNRTVAGYNDTADGVNLIIAAVDKEDSRPLWYSDWGTDSGGATNNLRRALDKVRLERGAEGYARFKSKLRLSSADAFGDHTTNTAPPFPIWVNTFQPEIERRRWYHRFSALTARAGGFDLMRDVLTGHGPLGALYPTNTTHWQKEGDSGTFVYLFPTGMNDPEQPGWGSWAGRYGRNEKFPEFNYFWANQVDAWNGTTNRDNTLARWAEALQNDFRNRLDWCVKPRNEANHPPIARLRGSSARPSQAGERVHFDASESSDPDGDMLEYQWIVYREAGTYSGELNVEDRNTQRATLLLPSDTRGSSIHVILAVKDKGTPPLTRYRRVVLDVAP